MNLENPEVFRLYLLRHAHAAWPAPGGRDFDRPLDAKGLVEARNVALQAYTAGLAPARIVSSPARRCVETTRSFLDIFGDLTADYHEPLYSGGVEAYIRQILEHRKTARSLMLVGHNPMMEALSEQLAVRGTALAGLAFGYPTAGLLAFDIAGGLTADISHRGEPVLLLTPALI